MKRLLIGLAIALAWPTASHASGDSYSVISCGVISNRNSSWQFGEFTWVEFIVETQRHLDLCPLSVAVEAWVVNVPNSAVTASDIFTASVRRQVPVFDYGVWQVNGKHWRIWAFLLWYENGHTVSHAEVRRKSSRDPAYECFQTGGYWNGDFCERANSPLIVDTARDGFRLTSVDDGVLFDLDADGVPERVAWTLPDSDDAWLAMDRNGNGHIDDGSELFGNHTPAHAGRMDVLALNGFEALKFAQGPTYGPSFADAQVDARDAVFGRLLLWRDRNHNGMSEPDELEPVTEAGLLSISTDYKTSKRKDRYGNEFRERAPALWADGESSFIYDVWLKSRKQ